jgi:hypothetical protein
MQLDASYMDRSTESDSFPLHLLHSPEGFERGSQFSQFFYILKQSRILRATEMDLGSRTKSEKKLEGQNRATAHSATANFWTQLKHILPQFRAGVCMSIGNKFEGLASRKYKKGSKISPGKFWPLYKHANKKIISKL